jgi:hypothetical protein
MAKKLLNEAAVRRFQSLANIKPIHEMRSSIEEEQVEETIEETVDETIEEGVYEADEAPEAPEAPEMDMAPEMPEEDPEEEAAALDDVELTDEEAQALIALGDKLAAAMEPEMDAAPDEMDAAPEMPEMGGEEEMMEALSGINYVPSQTEIVNEVARRVARRLAEAQKAEKKMNEALGRK